MQQTETETFGKLLEKNQSSMPQPQHRARTTSGRGGGGKGTFIVKAHQLSTTGCEGA